MEEGEEKMSGLILQKRTEKERIAYLVGKYFTDEIDLEMLKLQISAVEK